jgi:hypothetical protein
MQPAQLKSPNSPRTIVSNINPNRYGFGNINLNSIAGMSGMNDKIEKLSNLLKARGITMPSLYTPTPTRTPTTPTRSGDYGDDSGGVVTYTRQQFEDLYKKNANRQNMDYDNGGGGYFDKLFFMFQLYIAFINALMNAANMSASVIFGNKSLQNLFSVFLVNVLNMILKTDVGNLTPEQLRDLLEKNRPVLQQISAIIIDEASQLLVGLSDVCKKIALDWIENVVPGLVKSAAIGIPSALEAAIPPLGEVVEIVNTGLALMASFMKMVGAFQRNFDTVSQGYGHVKGAYDSLQKVRDLLSKDPSEIVKTANSAVASPTADAMAQNFFGNMLQPAAKTADLSNTSSSAVENVASEGLNRAASAMRNVASEGLNRAASAMRNVASQGLNRAASAVSNLLLTPNGSAVTDSNGAPITSSFWNRSWKRLFDAAVEKIKQSKIAMDKIRLNSGFGNDANGKPLASSIIVDYILKHPDILIPFLPAPYNIAAIAIRLVQTYIERMRKQSAATLGGGGGGSNRMKNRKYLKNTKHFNRYISNLRKKTAKKEVELINSIREFTSI